MKSPSAKPLEKDIQRDILAYLKLRKIMAWRNQTTGIYDTKRKTFRANQTMKGVPDILGILPNGQFLGIEVKRPGGKLSAEQQMFGAYARLAGAKCFVATSVKEVAEQLS